MQTISCDPRINRAVLAVDQPDAALKSGLDQLPTFEVFMLKKENTPFTYVGPVHAADPEVAFLYAKEQYSRRAQCFGLWVVPTPAIRVSAYTGDSESVYDLPGLPFPEPGTSVSGPWEVFQLKKRGKAHTYAGTVTGPDLEAAWAQARTQFGPCVNAWLIPAAEIYRSAEEEKEIWTTLPDKKYREPTAYKVLDLIKAFKTENNLNA